MQYPVNSISYSGLGSSVYSVLRDSLITGRFRPDTRLRIRDLASQLGTSVTPVRDAILQLSKEQALEMRTPKDIRVPKLNALQYEEIRTLRLHLEGVGAEKAALHISQQELQVIRKNIDLNHRAIEEGNLADGLRLNSEFHLLVAESARMPLLKGIIDTLWMRAGPLIAQAYAHFSERMAIEHHEELYQALRAHNSDAARNAIHQDIWDGNQKMAQFLETTCGVLSGPGQGSA
ncbi:GntR family transcriptional regulator [Klebsiella variicola]|uniref:GntR family transcriptional regulator n=1 Tax=Klebsiella variicola TaxID=244366 RepID=UPI002FF4E39C